MLTHTIVCVTVSYIFLLSSKKKSQDIDFNFSRDLNTTSRRIARKPGVQYHIGLDERNPDFDACEHQRRRPACASAQSDQRLCYALSEKKSN